MPGSDKSFSNAPRAKSWKGVTRTRSNRTTGNGVSGGSSNVFRVLRAFLFREDSQNFSKNPNLDLRDPEEVHAIRGVGDRGSISHHNHERTVGVRSDTTNRNNRHHRPERKCPGNAKGNVIEARMDHGSTPRTQFAPEDANVEPVSRKTRASSNGADTDSPSSCSSHGSSSSADTKEDDTAVGPPEEADASAGDRPRSTPAEGLPPLYETLFPLGCSTEEALVYAEAEGSAAIAAAPAFVKGSRSRSDRHVLMRGTASARQHASVSFKRLLTPSGEVSTTSIGASSTQGFHPPANDTAATRAAYGKKGPLCDDVFAGAPREPKKKVMLHDEEKIFIRSLHEIDVSDWGIINASPPLLGTNHTQNYAPVASPQAAAWGLKGKSHVTSDDCRLVPAGSKKTLVLDLDETLVSSRRAPCDCDFKIVFKIHFEEAGGSGDNNSNDVTNKVREVRYYIRLRPGMKKFLEKTSALYELVVWTASGKSYADAVIDLLDPDGKFFSYRLYREACTRHKGLWVKDLRRLGRPMDSVILLDNYVYSFGFTLDNGIPISPWTGNEEAKESGLKMAYTLLKHVARVPDVRVPLITAFDLNNTIHGSHPHLPPPPSMPLADVPASSLSRTSATAPPPSASVFASSPGALSENEVRTARGVIATMKQQ